MNYLYFVLQRNNNKIFYCIKIIYSFSINDNRGIALILKHACIDSLIDKCT